MRIVTHNGRFHTDDLLAVSALLMKFPESEVVRSRDEKVIEAADIVVDVGHIHDPKKLRFDHHQPGGAGEHHNSIPYASFGLVWKEFGDELCGSLEAMKIVEESIVMPVDAIDNGVSISNPIYSGVNSYSVGDYFETFNYGLESLEEYDKAFSKALLLAQDFLAREIRAAQDTVLDWRDVKMIYQEAEDKRLITLPRNMHWKKVLIPTDALFVIFSRSDGDWGIRAIPKDANNPFDYKKLFPQSWGGLGQEMLQGVTGVPDAVFCLKDRWLAAAKSKEGILKMAEIALNS